MALENINTQLFSFRISPVVKAPKTVEDNPSFSCRTNSITSEQLLNTIDDRFTFLDAEQRGFLSDVIKKTDSYKDLI